MVINGRIIGTDGEGYIYGGAKRFKAVWLRGVVVVAEDKDGVMLFD